MFKSFEYSVHKKKFAMEHIMTQADFNHLIRKACTYCHTTPRRHRGVDRIDSSKGYVQDNIRAACTCCNFLKSFHELEVFLTSAASMPIPNVTREDTHSVRPRVNLNWILEGRTSPLESTHPLTISPKVVRRHHIDISNR